MADFVEQLIDRFRNSERGMVRARIVEELGNTTDHRVLQPLIDAVNDDDMLVRWNAIQAISRFGNDAYGYLVRALETADDKFKRRNIVQAIGEVGSTETAVLLIRMLMFDESDPSVLIEIIRSLHKLKPPNAVEPLITVLKTNDWEMKWRAINTLGHIGDPKAMEPLLEVMNDDDPDIRWAASIAVENIKKKSLSGSNIPGADSAATADAEPIPPATVMPNLSAPPAEIDLTTSNREGWSRIHVSGDIIFSNAANFRGFVEGVISATTAGIEIDLKKCSFVDSFALSQFNNIRKKLKAKKRVLKFTNLNPGIKATFHATGLDELFLTEK
jgi:anti-anti-sigma factor